MSEFNRSATNNMTQDTKEVPDLSREDLAKRLVDFLEEYDSETDRAAVILCAAKLDYLLKEILKKYLKPVATGPDTLLDSDRGLGTFSAKIDACYRLGLIDAELARALNIFRKIRNEFAHEVTGAKLSEGSHRDRARELVSPFLKFETFKALKKRFKKSGEDRKDFFAATFLLVSRLEVLHLKVEMPPSKPMSLIPLSYLKKDE